MRDRVEKAPRRSRFKKIVFIVLGIALIIGVGVGWFINNYRTEKIVVEGCEKADEEMVRSRLVNSRTDKVTVLMYLKYKFKKPPKVPFVAKMDISMKDKHTIAVKVYEKIIIGCVQLKDSFLYFDKDGIVVESTKEHLEGIPLVEGLKFDRIVLYEGLEIQDNELFTTMLNLTQQIQKYKVKVNKVYFNSKNEVTLTCQGNNEALLGKKDFYDVQLSALAAVLEKPESKNLVFNLKEYTEETTQIIAKPKN